MLAILIIIKQTYFSMSKPHKVSKKQSHIDDFNYNGYNEEMINCGERCDYCNKFYDEELFLGELDYCINCWSVMDNDNFDCEKLIYNSEDTSIDVVISFLKQHYNNYMISGLNKDIENCIFNKIKEAIKNNKLHFLLRRELVKEVKKFVNLDNYKQFA